MMRRVDLLPAAYAERRRQRQAVFAVVVGGIVLLLLLAAYWFYLGMQVNDAENELAQVEAANDELRADIAELQRFAELENEVNEKLLALQTVMTGDVNWPAVLTEVAIVVPGEVWLTQLSGSAAGAEGAAPVGTETAPVRISPETPVGRLQFTGSSLTMPGVARWLIRQESVRDFRGVWLNSASERDAAVAGVFVVDFDSTLELAARALSGRFQGGEL